MGKRRKAQAPVAKVRPKLAKHFECPFCNSHASVDVKIDRVQGAGKAECGVCGQNFTAHTGMLDEAVDLYHAWLDACEDAIGQQVSLLACWPVDMSIGRNMLDAQPSKVNKVIYLEAPCMQRGTPQLTCIWAVSLHPQPQAAEV